MASLQIEDLVRGVATGIYVSKIGSHFGSLWGFDGLMEKEATPEEHAAFGASRKVKLCHGQSIAWLGQTWSAILAYNKEQLHQVNIHTDSNDQVFTDVFTWLEGVLGKGREVSLPQDAAQSVQHRIVWEGQSGVTTLVRTPTYMQISIGPTSPPHGAGCLSVVALFAGIGLLLSLWL